MSVDVETVGISGNSQDCLDAIATALQFGPRVLSATLVTDSKREDRAPHLHAHLFLLATENPDYPRFVIVRSGFTSGYSGEGPSATSAAILLLDSVGIGLDSREVEKGVFERIDAGDVSYEKLRALRDDPSRRGSSPYDYVLERDLLISHQHREWERWVEVRIPRALVNPSEPDPVLRTVHV